MKIMKVNNGVATLYDYHDHPVYDNVKFLVTLYGMFQAPTQPLTTRGSRIDATRKTCIDCLQWTRANIKVLKVCFLS
jgi:hypothetical protein